MMCIHFLVVASLIHLAATDCSDSSLSLYVADDGNIRARFASPEMISTDGRIHTICGLKCACFDKIFLCCSEADCIHMDLECPAGSDSPNPPPVPLSDIGKAFLVNPFNRVVIQEQPGVNFHQMELMHDSEDFHQPLVHSQHDSSDESSNLHGAPIHGGDPFSVDDFHDLLHDSGESQHLGIHDSDAYSQFHGQHDLSDESLDDSVHHPLVHSQHDSSDESSNLHGDSLHESDPFNVGGFLGLPHDSGDSRHLEIHDSGADSLSHGQHDLSDESLDDSVHHPLVHSQHDSSDESSNLHGDSLHESDPFNVGGFLGLPHDSGDSQHLEIHDSGADSLSHGQHDLSDHGLDDSVHHPLVHSQHDPSDESSNHHGDSLHESDLFNVGDFPDFQHDSSDSQHLGIRDSDADSLSHGQQDHSDDGLDDSGHLMHSLHSLKKRSLKLLDLLSPQRLQRGKRDISVDDEYVTYEATTAEETTVTEEKEDETEYSTEDVTTQLATTEELWGEGNANSLVHYDKGGK